MKHILHLEVDIDDYAKFPKDWNVWDLIVNDVCTASNESLVWRFGSAVRVRAIPFVAARRPTPPPTFLDRHQPAPPVPVPPPPA